MCRKCRKYELEIADLERQSETASEEIEDLRRHAADLTADLQWIQEHAGKDPRTASELVAQLVEGRLQPYVPPPTTLFDEQLMR